MLDYLSERSKYVSKRLQKVRIKVVKIDSSQSCQDNPTVASLGYQKCDIQPERLVVRREKLKLDVCLDCKKTYTLVSDCSAGGDGNSSPAAFWRYVFKGFLGVTLIAVVLRG